MGMTEDTRGLICKGSDVGLPQTSTPQTSTPHWTNPQIGLVYSPADLCICVTTSVVKRLAVPNKSDCDDSPTWRLYSKAAQPRVYWGYFWLQEFQSCFLWISAPGTSFLGMRTKETVFQGHADSPYPLTPPHHHPVWCDFFLHDLQSCF